MKKCAKCKIEKEKINFSKDKTKKDELSSWCKECVLIITKKYYINNKEKHLEYTRNYNKTWIKENKIHIKEYMDMYVQNNKDKIRQNEKIYKEKHYHISRWRDILKSTLKRFHRNKTSSTQTLLGYSAQELKEHLDKQNINWKLDHIDHIIPLSWFKKDTPPHIVNDLRNLRPLSVIENLKKSNKLGLEPNSLYINEIREFIKPDKLKLL
jgi:hypothetical protein